VWRRRHRTEEEDDTVASSGNDGAEEVLPCVRCRHDLAFVADQDFHEGTRAWGFLLGDLGELMTGGTKLEMWGCLNCGHVEFFVPGVG
jgi:hypothetical protein